MSTRLRIYAVAALLCLTMAVVAWSAYRRAHEHHDFHVADVLVGTST